MALDKRPTIERDSKGRFRGPGAYVASKPAQETEYTLLPHAEGKLSRALEDADLQLREASCVDGGVPTVVVRASPGVGKSTQQRQRMAASVEAGEAGRVAFHVPTLALAEEAAVEAAALGMKAQAIRGRAAARPDGSGAMCQKADIVAQASRLGLSVRENFCERTDDDGTLRRCPHFKECAYLAQFQTDATHAFMATAYLGLPDPSGVENAQRIVDETFWREFLWIRDVEAAAFQEPRTFLATTKVAEHAALLAAAGEVMGALIAGRSPLSLSFTAEDFVEFARLEREAEPPIAGLAPDQDTRKQQVALAEAAGNHRDMTRFSAIWSVLAAAKENGLTDCQRLRLYTVDRKHMLRIMRKRSLRHQEPMLVLDADADNEILSAIGCSVLAEHSLSLRPNAIVHQLHDRRMSNNTLLKQPKIREEWRRIIAREVLRDRLEHDSGVLVGATRKVVRAFFIDAGHTFDGMTEEDVSDFMLSTRLHGAHWLWFGGRSLGSNRYQNCSSVIVIGREELPVSALEDQGRALWGDIPDEPLQLLGADTEGNLRLPETEVQYEMTDGTAMAVKVPYHPDPRIRRLQMQSREGASRQLVERLRLARAQKPKRVILGSNIPIPGIPVDRLVTWEELCPTRVEAAITVGVLERGVVHLTYESLTTAAPSVFETLHCVKSHMKGNRAAADLLKDLKAEARAAGRGIDLCMATLGRGMRRHSGRFLRR